MSTLFDLAGKAALVVGGHGGIGKAIALGLADAGADKVEIDQVQNGQVVAIGTYPVKGVYAK